MYKRFLKSICLLILSSILISILLSGCDFSSTPSSESSKDQAAQSSLANPQNSTVPTISIPDFNSQTEVSDESSVETSEETSEAASAEPLVPAPVQDTSLHGKTVEECNSFFDDSVLIGDSFIEGFKNRNRQQGGSDKNYFGKIVFLSSQNFGYLSANATIAEGKKTYHPTYGGEQRYVWDVVGELKPPRIIISLGLNDLEGKDAEIYTFASMKKMMGKLREASPNSEIVMFSVPYYAKDGEKPNMYRTNEINRNWNEKMLKYCNDNGYDFINLSDSMVNDEGYLDDKYAGPDKLHLKADSYYDRWLPYLRSYAANKLLGQYSNVETVLWKRQ